MGAAAWQHSKAQLTIFTKQDKCDSLCPSVFLSSNTRFSIPCSPCTFFREWWGKQPDQHDFHSPLRSVWTPTDPIKKVLEMMRYWSCGTMAISITSIQLESLSNWYVFPTQVIYENWDENEPNNHEELEHCVMFNRSPQMRWNDLRCEHLLNWICETKKGIITSPFNWSNKLKFKKQILWI